CRVFVVQDDVEAETTRFVEDRVTGVVQRRFDEGLEVFLLHAAEHDDDEHGFPFRVKTDRSATPDYPAWELVRLLPRIGEKVRGAAAALPSGPGPRKVDRGRRRGSSGRRQSAIGRPA